MSATDELADRCASVADLAREALEWVTDETNAEIIGPGRKSLEQRLRRASRRAQKLGKSARTKVSVSVFGPSQAGKSFLVSVLARPENGRLFASFPAPGGALDYISEINPEGEGESTGLVTRFTMTGATAPEGFPIRLTLLSEADIARTVINSFYMDGDQSDEPPEPSSLSAHLDAFRNKVGRDVPGVEFEDVLEIAEYVNNTFGRSAYAAALRTFWDEAAEIAPRLLLPERAGLFAILWGGHDALTDLYLKLATALSRIGHADEVHVPLAALVPRETSIIDVKTLHDLTRSETAEAIQVRTPDGKVEILARPELCALAAELVLPMQTAPSEIFEAADLLDFPGARNRFERPLSETLRDAEANLSQLLLRGKVAYLFDRYVENQEITSMLLCVPDSNMETVDLPGLIENWIALTHGNSPEKRRDGDCILFLVLTKFDKHLGESAAAGGVATRFQRRMEASLEKFGKNRDPWVDHWTPGKPFRNCFWLRNPNFFVEGLIDYDDNHRELRLRPEKQERLAQLREGCLSAPDVRKHFDDPVTAWDAALTLNDGGVRYLIGKLREVCKPDSKLRQIDSQIEKVIGDLLMGLGGFHVSDDTDERIEEKRLAAARVIDSLEHALRGHRFGAVLSQLLVEQDAISDRIARVPSSIRISGAASLRGDSGSTAARSASTVHQGIIRPGRPQTLAARASNGSGRSSIRTMTPEAFQAETAVEVWVDELKTFRESADLLSKFGFSDASANDLVNELIHGLRRTGVIGDIVGRLKSISFGHTVDKQAQPASIVCAECINTFVTYLGVDKLPERERPRVALPDGGSRAVFAAHVASDTADDLPREQRAVAEEIWTDWVHALDALFVGNVTDSETGTINAEQNRRLGSILAGLRRG